MAAIRIAVVDDDPDLRLLARITLEEEIRGSDMHICEASNGRELLDLCAREHLDLIVLDLHMPEMNGLSVLEQLNTLPDRPSVVAWSADEIALEAAADMGASATAMKGSSRGNELVDAVRDLLANADRPAAPTPSAPMPGRTAAPG